MSNEYPAGFGEVSFCRVRMIVLLALAWAVSFAGFPPLPYAAEPGVLEGRILDSGETLVTGGEVYIFDTPDVKRPADFISNRTAADGRYQVRLLPGNYWAVAVFRQGGGRYGPLASGDKHSGEPAPFEVTSGVKRTMDFVVRDLREAARQHRKKSADLVRVTGRLVDGSGNPASQAYAMAHKTEQFGNLPDYISAWTDEKGDYILYLPPGRYYLGASVGYPPAHGYNLSLHQEFAGDADNVDLVVDGEKSKFEGQGSEE